MAAPLFGLSFTNGAVALSGSSSPRTAHEARCKRKSVKLVLHASEDSDESYDHIGIANAFPVASSCRSWLAGRCSRQAASTCMSNMQPHGTNRSSELVRYLSAQERIVDSGFIVQPQSSFLRAYVRYWIL